MVAARCLTSGFAGSLLTTVMMVSMGPTEATALGGRAPQDPMPAPASAVCPPDCATMGGAPDRQAGTGHARVRTMTEAAHRLLARATERSSTIAAMVDAIGRSDVFVYVETRTLSRSVHGYVQLTASTRRTRYLRLVLGVSDPECAQIAVLGHELRHVLEIVGMPDVRDQRSLIERYREIGVPMAKGGYYETAAALTTQRRVARELAAWLKAAPGTCPH